MEHHAIDLQKIRDSNLPEIIKTDVEDMISWEFDETRMDGEALFSILERGVFHRVTSVLENLGLCEDNIREVVLCYENVAERLFDIEYLWLEMIFPRTLYMNCIRSLVYSRNRPVNETCWYHVLPRQMRFHVMYFQHLSWFTEARYTDQMLNR